MSTCPLCSGPHELPQCPRWRIPEEGGVVRMMNALWMAWLVIWGFDL